MEKIPLSERTIATEIAAKILQFQDQKAQEAHWATQGAQMQKAAQASCQTIAGMAAADLRRGN